MATPTPGLVKTRTNRQQQDLFNASGRYKAYTRELKYCSKVIHEFSKPIKERSKKLVGAWSQEGITRRYSELTKQLISLATKYPEMEAISGK